MDGPRPSNHHANLAVTIRDRLDSCQCRYTLIPRLTGALLRRASSTMEQTLGHRRGRDSRKTPQADGRSRNRLLGLISLMTMMMRILCSMIRPAAQNASTIRIRHHGLHRATGPSVGQIASLGMEDSGEMLATGLQTIPALLHDTMLLYQAPERLLLQGLQLGGLQLGETAEAIPVERPGMEGHLLEGP